MTQPPLTTSGTQFPSLTAAVSRSSVALAAELGASRWSDEAFLNALRQLGDVAGDRCATDLAKIPGSAQLSREIFTAMPRNDSPLPANAPECMKTFFDETYAWCTHCHQPSLPSWVDRDRIIRGQQAFMDRMIPSVLVLLCKSLPEGYATPGATKILNISGELLTHTYHRLMGTLQLLVDVSSPQSFERAGTALLRGQQMRLLHSGVRTMVAPSVLERRGGYKTYVDRYGVPVNQEDMLATMMAFSLLVVRGWRTLNVAVSDQEAEDFYYVWRVFAQLMGLHPPGEEENDCHVPANLTDASVFYEAYRRRHYAGATAWTGDWAEQSKAENPDGVALADRHVKMLTTLLPERESRFLQLEHVVRVYVEKLIGEDGCARVAIPRLRGHIFLRLLLLDVPRLWARAWRRVDGGVHVWLSKWFLQSLVKSSYEQGVVFTVPASVADLQALVDRGATLRGSMAVHSDQALSS